MPEIRLIGFRPPIWRVTRVTLVEVVGFEPATCCLQSSHSTN